MILKCYLVPVLRGISLSSLRNRIYIYSIYKLITISYSHTHKYIYNGDSSRVHKLSWERRGRTTGMMEELSIGSGGDYNVI